MGGKSFAQLQILLSVWSMAVLFVYTLEVLLLPKHSMLSRLLWQPPVEMRFHLLFLAKPSCQISLFVIFLYFFGMPNIERYQKQEVMVVSSTKLSGGFPAPTISVSAMNNFTRRGWKSNKTPPAAAVELIDFYCGNASDIQKCILDGTYNRSDVVKYVQIGYNRNESLMDPRFWQEVFQDPYYGRRFTLNIAGRRITPNYYQDQIYLQLRPGLFYTVYIFDQNFFLRNANRLSFPMTIKHVTSSGYFWAISVTETFELNHPKDPCFEGIFTLFTDQRGDERVENQKLMFPHFFSSF